MQDLAWFDKPCKPPIHGTDKTLTSLGPTQGSTVGGEAWSGDLVAQWYPFPFFGGSRFPF